jgi:hypothetical protein
MSLSSSASSTLIGAVAGGDADLLDAGGGGEAGITGVHVASTAVPEGTFRCRGEVFLIHQHVVPTTDPDVRQMTEFRDLLRSDPPACAAYAAYKRRITADISDSLDYTHAKTSLIRRQLGASPTADIPASLDAR